MTASAAERRAWAPCGACAEMVPAETGCKHWKPKTARTVRAASVPRARQREYDKAARDRAVASVEQFLKVRATPTGPVGSPV